MSFSKLIMAPQWALKTFTEHDLGISLQEFDFNESFPIEDRPDILLVLRSTDSTVQVKQCAGKLFDSVSVG